MLSTNWVVVWELRLGCLHFALHVTYVNIVDPNRLSLQCHGFSWDSWTLMKLNIVDLIGWGWGLFGFSWVSKCFCYCFVMFFGLFFWIEWLCPIGSASLLLFGKGCWPGMFSEGRCISMMLSQNMFRNLTGACYVLVASRRSLSSWCSIFNRGLHKKRYCLSTMVFPQGVWEGNGIHFHGSINFNSSS